MTILVTGGAGYIGSHTCIELISAGYDVVVVDNLCNSCKEALDRVEKIVGKTIKFYEADIRDAEAMKNIFEKEDIDAVIHFAGLKSVGESVAKPLEYYDNNIAGTLVLCDAMRNAGVKNIIFSSSATVYGDPAFVRRPGNYPDHRRMPKRTVHKSIWMVKINAGTDFNRSSYSRFRMERSITSLLQSSWST